MRDGRIDGGDGNGRRRSGGPSFIEVQFPISKISKECYKERKAGSGQTLTGLGKWWGRKPLVLVRAALLGLLMPASDDPAADRRVFLKLLTMDDEGLWQRRTKSIPAARLHEMAVRPDAHGRPSPFERSAEGWFIAPEENGGKAAWRPEISRDDRVDVTRRIFERLRYDEKLEFCARPEELEGPSEQAWGDINAHLGTHATSLQELVRELGTRRFGGVPRVGDAFCGGGSIPFEAARLGCDVYASDLNPVAALLTWGALNIVGGGPEVAKQVAEAREKLFAAVDAQITEWGIEHNAQGWRADLYLYCYETKCPECGWRVPLAGSWVISEKSRVIADLVPRAKGESFDIRIREDASQAEVARAKTAGTIDDGEFVCPSPGCMQREVPTRIKVSALRGDRRGGGDVDYGIRAWDERQLVAGPDDLYHERLYCIRWVVPGEGRGGDGRRVYRGPDCSDLVRERETLNLLQDRYRGWRARGLLPNTPIRMGGETRRIRRDLGATHWHHLFNPRQLLMLGTMADLSESLAGFTSVDRTAMLLGLGLAANFSSRLCRNHAARDYACEALYTHAFPTSYNYACRGFSALYSPTRIPTPDDLPSFNVTGLVSTVDARTPLQPNHVWITDPPYADAINYHELCDFFLAWYRGPMKKLFPEWHVDGRHALAVTDKDEQFRASMADIYKALAERMPDDGMQIVMFTHTDAGVWADLCMILWAAGLQVTAAWCIATETGSEVAQKDNGNYVQGTVLVVLRKRTSSDIVFLDELVPLVDTEVRRQLDAMHALDDARDPSFSDPDYQLAAYAAALKVLTAHSAIEDFDVARELARTRAKGEVSPLETLIRQAVETACNHLIPDGFDAFIWKQLTPGERYYLKGLDMETRGVASLSAYQELARGFRFNDYKPLLHARANEARLRTATELARKGAGDEGFGQSTLRMALIGIHDAVKKGDAREGLGWLRAEVPDYWNRRRTLIALLQFLARSADTLPHWQTDAAMAHLLAGAIENDHV